MGMITLRDAFTRRDFSCMNITSFLHCILGHRDFSSKKKIFGFNEKKAAKEKISTSKVITKQGFKMEIPV